MSKNFTKIMAFIMSILMVITVLPTEYILSYALEDEPNSISFVENNDEEIEYTNSSATIKANTYNKEYELKTQFNYAIDYSTKDTYNAGEVLFIIPSFGFYDNGVTAGYIMPTDISVNNTNTDIWQYEKTTIGNSKVIKITNKIDITSEIVTEGYMQFATIINPRTMLVGDITLNPITVLMSYDGGTNATQTNSLSWGYTLYNDEFSLTETVKDVQVESDTALGNDASDYYWAKYEIVVDSKELHSVQANNFKITSTLPENAILYSVNGDTSVTTKDNQFVYDFTIEDWNYTQLDEGKTISIIVKYPKTNFDGSEVTNNSVLTVKYLGSDEYVEVANSSVKHSLHDYSVVYDGDLFAVYTYKNPGYEISWNSLNRNEASPFSFYISGISKYNGDHSAIFTNDKLEILKTNGTFYRLTNDEYTFNQIIINDLSHFTNSIGEQYNSLDYAILLNDEIYKTGTITNNSQTIVLPETMNNAVSIAFYDLSGSLYLDSTAIQVVGTIKVDNANEIMTEGELRNLVYLLAINNTNYDVMNVVDETNYTGSDAARLAEADLNDYGFYVQRGIDSQVVTYKSSQINVTTKFNPTTSVYNKETKMQDSILDITSFFGAPGEVDKFSLYTILPSNMNFNNIVSYSAEDDLILADGTIISGSTEITEFLDKNSNIEIIENYKSSGRTYIKIDFDFEDGKAICYDSTMTNGFTSGKITVGLDVSVPNESATYNAVVGMIFNDEHSETILTTKDNGLANYVSVDGVLWVDIDNDNDVEELIDYAKSTLTSVYVEANNEPIKVPSISITKVAEKEVYKLGETIVYTITVKNDGETPLTNVIVTDSLTGTFDTKDGVTTNGNKAIIPSMAIGEVVTLTYKVVVPTDAKDGDIVNNIVTVVTDENVKDTDEEDVTIEVKTPSVSITKVAEKEIYKLGETIVYTITVKNDGETSLTNVIVTDSLTGTFDIKDGVTTNGNKAIIPSMAIGEVVTLTYKVVVPTDAKDGDIVKNIVTVTTNENVTDEANENVTIEVKIPSISITKVAEKEVYTLGETIVYTITVKNDGETPLTNVIVTDSLTGTFDTKDGVTTNGNKAIIPSMAIGEVVTLTYKVAVPTDAKDGDIVKNIVTVTTDEKVSNQANENVIIEVKTPSVSITKVAEKEVYKLGETIVYTITVKNDGETPLTNVVVTDNLIGTFDAKDGVTTNKNKAIIPSMAIGEIVTLTYKVVVPSNAKDGDIIKNIVVVVTDEKVSDEANEDVTIEVKTPSVSIIKVAEKEVYKLGETIVYTITVKNDGETPLTNVIVTDSLTGTFDTKDGVTTNGNKAIIPSMAIGEVVTLTYKVAVPTDAKDGDIVKNIVTVTTNEKVSDEANENVTIEVPTIVKENPSVDIIKVVEKSIYNPEDVAIYGIKVTNDGNVDLTNVKVIETLSGKFTNTSSNVTIIDDMNVVISSLKVGESETFTFEYKIPKDAKDNSSIKNIVKVNEEKYDLSDKDDVTITIVEKENPSLDIIKVADKKSTKVGDKITYTITVTNNGNIDLKNVNVVDSLKTGKFTNVKDVTVVNDYTLIIPELKVGESKAFTFVYTVSENDKENVVNIATAIETTNSLKVEDKVSVEIEQPIKDIVQTGDNAPIVLFLGLAFVSFIGMCIVFISSKNKKNN